MPHVNVKTSSEISDVQKEVLKAGLADIMQKVAGKSENWLMVSFCHETIYFKGEKCDKAAFIDIKLVGSLSKSQKSELSDKICAMLNKEIGIPSEFVYLVITEVDGENWGWNCSTF